MSIEGQLNTRGFVNVHYLDQQDHLEVHNMTAEGLLENLVSAGIKFMNEDYFFIRKGNPDGVHVYTKGGVSSLVKTYTTKE